MANYWKEFTADTLAGFPSGMTARLHGTSSDLSVIDISSDSPPTGFTRAAQFLAAQITNERCLYSLDAVDSDGDRATVKIAALLRFVSQGDSKTTTTGCGVAGRGAGSSSSETMVAGAFGRTDSDDVVRISEYNAATVTGSDIVVNTLTDDTWYWFVLELDGTSSTLTVYPENDPGGTAVGSTPSRTLSATTGVGWAGLFAFNVDADMVTDVAALEVATGTSALNYADGSGDVTAPVLSSPTGTQTGATTASGTVSTDEANGTLDAVVTTSATTPSVAQIQAGQDHTGAAAVATDLANTVSATGAQNVSFTGLTASTTYYVHYVHQDAAGNDSNTVTSASFTTSGSVTEGFTLNLNDGAADQANLTGIYCLVWDGADPDATAADFFSATETTDGNGDMTVDLSSIAGLAVSDTVFVVLWKPDASVDEDSLGFQGRITVADIS